MRLRSAHPKHRKAVGTRKISSAGALTVGRATLALLVGLIAVPIPAGAAAPGTIRGRVLDGRDDRPVADVGVVLTVTDPGGETRGYRTTTDRKGRYLFDDLPAGNDRIFALDAEHDDGLFAGGAVKVGPGDVIDTTLRVWPTIDDPDVMLVQRDNLFVTPAEGGLDVIEAVTVANTSGSAYIGRGMAPAEDGKALRVSLGFALPPGAARSQVQIVDSEINVPQLIRTDYGFGVTTAIPPGEWTFTFAYKVAGSAGNYQLGRTALYPVVTTTVHATDPLEVESNRLTEAGEVTIGGTRYRRWSSTDALDAGDILQASATAEGSSAPGLQLGLVVAAVLIVALGGVALVRRRKPPRGEAAFEPEIGSRDALLRQVAELDLAHEAGEIPDDAWATTRSALKARLASMREPEPTP